MYETAFVSVPAIHLDMEVRAGFRLEFVVVDHPKLFDAMGKSTLLQWVRWRGDKSVGVLYFCTCNNESFPNVCIVVS